MNRTAFLIVNVVFYERENYAAAIDEVLPWSRRSGHRR